MIFDRDTYFASVRQSLFNGSMTQNQVDGQDTILTAWETYVPDGDLRFLAYELATTMHETAQEFMPIEEYGHGAGQPYGEVDPDTGQAYYGRGYVQLTWRSNYSRADAELGLSGDQSCEWHADNALVPELAARIMHQGMTEGWFRSDEHGAHTLGRYFQGDLEDAFGAREIINGDKNIVPDWSGGISIGHLIEGYYEEFLHALAEASARPANGPVVAVTIVAPPGIDVIVNGRLLG